MNRNQFVDQLKSWCKKEHVSLDDVWVSHGGALLIMGLREETQDIDLTCNKKLFDKIAKKGGYEWRWLDNGPRIMPVTDTIDLHDSEREPILTKSKDGIWHTDIYQTYADYKQLNRDKDQDTIKMLEKLVNA